MAHDDNQDKDKKDKKDELLQEKLIKAYGSYSNIGMAKYHIRETAKLALSSREYNAIDLLLNSGKKYSAEISDKLHMSVESMKKLYHSAVETLVDYQRQIKKRQDEEFYSVQPRFLSGYSF